MKGLMKSPAIAKILAISGTVAATAFAQSAPPKPAAPATPPPALSNATDVSADTVVLTIGEQKLTRAQFELLLGALAQSGRPAATPQQKRQVAEQYAELETMAQEARKRKLDESPEAKQMIKIQADSYLATMAAKTIGDDVHFTDLDLRAYYDANKNEFEEAEGSHILIRFQGSKVPLRPNEKDLTDAEALAKAEDIRKKLVAGADFAALAKEESDDTGSGAQGGSLGTFRHGQMVGPFDQAAFSLPIGQVSEPVKTQFGYHIIKMKSRTNKSFEDAKAQIERELKPKMGRDAIDQVKARTAVSLNDAYFGPKEAAQPPMPVQVR